MTSRADALLAGRRGRRLCLGVVLDPIVPGWPGLTWSAGSAGSPVGRSDRDESRRSLAGAVGTLDLAALTATADPAGFLPALLATVDSARYWQEPDDVDLVLADDEVAALLRPVAEAVVAAPGSAWWAGPLAVSDQHAVIWEPADAVPRLAGTRPALLSWREHTVGVERRAAGERPADPRAHWSGEWWSTPATAGLVVTTRALPGLLGTSRPAPTQLLLVEDELGWRTATTWPVPLPEEARVLEITSPGEWADLVG